VSIQRCLSQHTQPHDQTPKNAQCMFNSPYTQPTPSLLPQFPTAPFHAMTKETVPALVVALFGMLGGVKMPIGYPSTPSSLSCNQFYHVMFFSFITDPACLLHPSNGCFCPHQEWTRHLIPLGIPDRRFSSSPLLLRHPRGKCSPLRLRALIPIIDGTPTCSRLS
jgi:hypothetical protein